MPENERYCCPLCFTNDTMVSVNNNLAPIVNVNGSADGLGNDFRKCKQRVLKSFARDYSGEMVKLKIRYLPEITITPEHPILIRRLHLGKKQRGTSFIWKKAGELRHGDFVLIPRAYYHDRKQYLDFGPFISKFDKRSPLRKVILLDETWAELMGWYVAEGHSSPKEIVFSLNREELDNIARIRQLAKNIGYSTYISHSTAAQIHVTSRILPRAFKSWFGKGAKNKQVPGFIMNASSAIRQSFLKAYLAGDGCRDNKRGRDVVSSASERLIRQFQFLCLQEGLIFSYGKTMRGGIIEGRELPKTAKYTLERNDSSRYVIMTRRFVYLPVAKVEKINYTGKVYNLQTEDGTYQVPFIVHNCGWWRTYPFGISQQTGAPREVRFDKVDVENAPMWHRSRLRGAGRGSHNATIEFTDSKTLAELPDEIKEQFRTQCHKILDILE